MEALAQVFERGGLLNEFSDLGGDVQWIIIVEVSS